MIEFKNIFYKYFGQNDYAVKNFNLKIERGSCVLLTGRSGCGKTTITRMINGLIPNFYEGDLKGKILFDGIDISKLKVYEISKKVGSVFQDPRTQFFATDTTSELAFTCENFSISPKEICERINKTVCEFKIENLLDRSIFDLSSGEKQKIAIGSIYAFSPEIYVLDEPSANLDNKSTENLRRILTKFKEEGKTIIISEHRLSYLKDIFDKVVVIESGEKIHEYKRKEFINLPKEKFEGLGLRSVSIEKIDLCYKQNNVINKNLLEVKNIEFSYENSNAVLKNVSFTSKSSDVVAIVGNNGAGKTTLAEVLCGFILKNKGSILFNGKEIKEKKLINYIYYVMQDSDYQLFTDGVEEELLLNNSDSNSLIKANEVLEILALLKERKRHPASLSGGQKQRLAIGTSYMKNKEILILDEPTSGLDFDNMNRVSLLIDKLKNEGKIILLISHDTEFIMKTCNRILHLEKGEIVKDFYLNKENIKRFKEIFEKED